MLFLNYIPLDTDAVDGLIRKGKKSAVFFDFLGSGNTADTVLLFKLIQKANYPKLFPLEFLLIAQYL